MIQFPCLYHWCHYKLVAQFAHLPGQLRWYLMINYTADHLDSAVVAMIHAFYLHNIVTILVPFFEIIQFAPHRTKQVIVVLIHSLAKYFPQINLGEHLNLQYAAGVASVGVTVGVSGLITKFVKSIPPFRPVLLLQKAIHHITIWKQLNLQQKMKSFFFACYPIPPIQAFFGPLKILGQSLGTWPITPVKWSLDVSFYFFLTKPGTSLYNHI